MPRTIMVERAEAMLTLAELLAAGRRGAGTVVAIEGAASVGKTALLHAFASSAAESGALVLSASASPAERDLPLSAVSQIFRDPALPSAEAERVERLLQDGVMMAMSTALGIGYDTDAGVQVPAPILNGLSEIVLDMAERTPLVIGVDDIHYADAASLQFLLYLARRIRSARILMALTECIRPSRPHPMLHADLLCQPDSPQLRLRPLSLIATAAVLTECLDAGAAERLASDCYSVSGGNPAVVHALIEDYRMFEPVRPARLVFGDAFRRAVLTCIYRCESTALACGIATLAKEATPALLGELLRSDAESIELGSTVLRATGLLGPSGFRHDAVQTAVLSGMRPGERAVLHVRAAELLHSHGGPAMVVADRLMAADEAKAAWAVKVLQDAAEQALNEGRVSEAISYLRLAVHECTDDQRLAIRLDLVRAAWYIDPAAVAGHLPELMRGLLHGRLPAGSEVSLITWMLWLGRVDDVFELMLALSSERAQPLPGARLQPGIPHWWFRYAYPGLARLGWPEGAPQASSETVSVRTSPHVKVGAMLATVLTNGSHDETHARADQILHESGLTFRALTPVVAIATLIYIDELDDAAQWCELLGRPSAQFPPLGNALLLTLRALIHYRRGEFKAAEKFAYEGFTFITVKGWGVVIGIPLATLLLTLTAMGKYEKIESYLDTRVPDVMFHTPHALPYLQARGRYYLTVDRPQAALVEFQACGDLMVQWGFDVPSFVPWRTEMAEAHLALGNRQDANRLATEQLKLLDESQRRTRGITLHALAVASDIDERLESMMVAVELLEQAGDRFELARALADLSETFRAVGDAGRAKTMAQRARVLAAECGAENVWRHGSSSTVELKERGGGLESDPLAGLSNAERRVAILAANGDTNRQIADRLHLTASTVEQHLTKVYRKLGIGGRTDLPLKLLLARD